MAGILEKARIAVLSTAHSLMDKIIDMNSVGAVKQYIRDLEASLEDLEDALAAENGRVRTLERDAEQIKVQMEELNRNIDFILTDNKPENDSLATPLEARLIGLEQRLKTKHEELESARKTAQALGEAVATLRTKHQNMVEQVLRLEALDKATKAKESAAAAIKQAGRIAGAGQDVSIDAVEERMQRRADIADARFERALGEMSDQVEKDAVIAQAKARLEERKARLQKSNP